MLRQMLNELEINVTIACRGYLLVKDGRYTKEKKAEWTGGDEARKKEYPDMIFISRSPLEQVQAALGQPTRERRMQAMDALQYYLPGSSVRGAWRAHLERELRSLDSEPKVCDPLLHERKENEPPDPYEACSGIFSSEKSRRPKTPYAVSCPVCRLFGNTVQASRIAFSDGRELQGAAEMVDNISISRQTGSVLNPFKAIALRDAEFELVLRLRNFELWQVGLLARLFEDLKQRRVPLGSGKNKGLGDVAASATRVVMTYFGKDHGQDGKLLGIAEILHEPARSKYQLAPAAAPPSIDAAPVGASGWRYTREITGPGIDSLWKKTGNCFNGTAWDALPFLKDRKAAVAAEAPQ